MEAKNYSLTMSGHPTAGQNKEDFRTVHQSSLKQFKELNLEVLDSPVAKRNSKGTHLDSLFGMSAY